MDNFVLSYDIVSFPMSNNSSNFNKSLKIHHLILSIKKIETGKVVFFCCHRDSTSNSVKLGSTCTNFTDFVNNFPASEQQQKFFPTVKFISQTITQIFNLDHCKWSTVLQVRTLSYETKPIFFRAAPKCRQLHMNKPCLLNS